MKSLVERARSPGMALALWALLAGAQAAQAAEVGQAAPEVEWQGAAGVVRLAELKGKVVYVDFWASWCGPCRQSFPWMNEMQAKYGARGFQVLAVNLDAKRSDAEQFLAQVPAKFALAFDAKGDSARRFGIKGMPTSVLIAADGKVAAVHQGFREDERQAMEQRLVAALAGRQEGP